MNLSEKNNTVRVYLEFDCLITGEEGNYSGSCLNIPEIRAKGYTKYMVIRALGDSIKLQVQIMINKEIPLPKVAVR